MDTNSDVELILGGVFYHVLVATNTSSLKSFGGKLFKFIRYKMDA